jgi:hypothetical protein
MNPTVSIRFTASSIRMAPMDDRGFGALTAFLEKKLSACIPVSGYPKSRSLCSQLKLFKP